MKILSNFYIFIVLLSKGIGTKQEQRRNPSLGKFNPDYSSSKSLRLLSKQKQNHDTEVNLLSPVTRVVECLRRRRTDRSLDKLTDKNRAICRHRYQLRAKVSATMRRMKKTKKTKRTRREAKLPARFLLRFPPEPLRDRRHSKRKVRNTNQLRRRKKRKRKRSDDVLLIKNNANAPRNCSHNGEVAVGGKQIIDKGNKTDKSESNQSTRQVVFTILACLMALTASALLLLYLYKRSRKESSFDHFFCPPEIGKSQDNLEEEIDRCTCCSSHPGEKLSGRISRRSSQTYRSRRSEPQQQQQQQQPPQQQRKIKRMKLKKKTRKKPPLAARRKPATKFNEDELKLIQSKIACILRNECTDCQCCKCNIQDETEPPKRSRFKFFRKKKNTLCNDVRCDENKINCLTNLCGASLAEDSEVRNANMFRGNPCENSTSKAKRKLGLRIKE